MKQEVLSFLKERGWEELNCSKQKLHYPDFIQTISTLSDNQFVQDVHIENLLVFPRNVQFYNMDYFHDSSLILQDKVSYSYNISIILCNALCLKEFVSSVGKLHGRSSIES
jgi:hypothetical protein